MKTKDIKPSLEFNKKKATTNTTLFPIVGVGASAGGLEALELLLGNVPENSGMAYIVIQHMDPTQKGMLPELLQRVSKINVCQVEDGMKVQPNCIYIIPPNKSMSILKGVLYLFEPVEPRGLRLPIDFFLHSLAADQREFAIGIILSGMGSDGSNGIGAIKENDGVVMAQEPDSAKFNSMPENAINSGLVDIITTPQEMYLKLTEFIQHVPIVKSDDGTSDNNKSAFEKIIILLRTHTGNDFSMYKKNTVYRRIERRMSVHRIDEINSYVHFLQKNPKEVHILFKELMIGVTQFFRDPLVWDNLKEKILPLKIEQHQGNPIIRGWVPGCSTGEEAYSLAIILREVIEQVNPNMGFTIQIFATDLDNDAIETARKGMFPNNIEADVSIKRLSRFFTKTDEGYRINTEIRESIVFAQHNIIMHPPFTDIDIITCRNLLIYLDHELQEKLYGLFFYSLNSEGHLILGSSESLGSQSHLFTSINSSLKIYKRSPSDLNEKLFDFPSSFSRSKMSSFDNKKPIEPLLNIQELVDQLLLENFSPAGVLINENGDILYISGRTGKYLEPSVGKANMNIFAMLRNGLQNDFAIAFRKVITKKETVILNNVKINTNGSTIVVNVNIHWISKPQALFGKILIIFRDVDKSIEDKKAPKGDKNTLASNREKELEEELQHAREEIQNISEEMQTSQEELKSANEELQSTNEEIQSSNEELTTSKEEMQSLNEELQTVNAELQSKVNDYSQINNDMRNLLDSTDIATLFLDKKLNIRRFTNQATKIFKLIKSDIGRPFTDQVSELIYPELSEDALEVLRTLIYTEKQIPTKDGRWFSTRIMPYRTFDDRIDGLVITFIDISNLKKIQENMNDTSQVLRLLLDSSSDITIQLSTDWEIVEFNSAAEDFFGMNHGQVINRNYINLFVPKTLRKETNLQLNDLLIKAKNDKIKMKVIGADGIKMEIEMMVNVVLNSHNVPSGVIITSKK